MSDFDRTFIQETDSHIYIVRFNEGYSPHLVWLLDGGGIGVLIRFWGTLRIGSKVGSTVFM